MDRQHRPEPQPVLNTFSTAHEGNTHLRRAGTLRAVQLLVGHTKIEGTVRYLGIEVDDALAIAEQVDVRIGGQSRRALPHLYSLSRADSVAEVC